VTEQRDVQKDWSLLFGDEPMPKIVAVGVFTDSHSTKQPVKAWYRDLVIAKLPELVPKVKPVGAENKL
jgi:hypothetical protein